LWYFKKFLQYIKYKHFFMYLLAICTSFGSCLFSVFANLFNGLLFICRFSFSSSLCILVHVLDIKLAKIFSHSICYLFSLVTVFFLMQEFLVWCSPVCKFFLLIAEQLEPYSYSYYLHLYAPVYSLFFPIELS
jgi:hypothetical protein